MFERLKEAINAALDAATSPPDSREIASQMRDAVIEARAAIEQMRDDLRKTEEELAAEQRHLSDAERRGRLAQQIDDHETVSVAERFREKHRERVRVLTDKLSAQKAELALAERELTEMKSQLKSVAGGKAFDAAWRELESATRGRSGSSLDDDVLRSNIDRAAREAQAEARLEALKKKMGK